jgi:hypothetical protein
MVSAKESRNNRNAELIAFELDKSIMSIVEQKVKKLGLTKRQYLTNLVLKDLGYTIIPAQVIPPKIVKIERDEESV